MSVIFADGRNGRRVQLVVKVASPWPYSAGIVQSRWVVQSGLHGYDFVVLSNPWMGLGLYSHMPSQSSLPLSPSP